MRRPASRRRSREKRHQGSHRHRGHHWRRSLNGDCRTTNDAVNLCRDLTARRFPGAANAQTSGDGARVSFSNSEETGSRIGIVTIATRQVRYLAQNGISEWDAPGVWQVGTSGGALAQRRSLPKVCNQGDVAISIAAPRGVCTARATRGDIWWLHVPGVTR